MSWEARVAQSQAYVARVEADFEMANLNTKEARQRLVKARIKKAGRLLKYLGVEEILKDVRTVWGEGEIKRAKDPMVMVLETGLERVFASEPKYGSGEPRPLSIGVGCQTISLGVRLDMGIAFDEEADMMKPPMLTVFDRGRFPTDFKHINQVEGLGDVLREVGLGRLRYITQPAVKELNVQPDRSEELDRPWSLDAPDRLNHIIVEMVEERRAMGALPGEMRSWHNAIRDKLPPIIQGRYLGEGSYLGEEKLKAHFGIVEQAEPELRRRLHSVLRWLDGLPRSKPAA